MKRCNACGEEFEDRFSFCPVDGTPINTVPAAMTTFDHSRSEWTGRIPPEFKLTIISTTGLLVRLSNEARFLAREIKVAWPEFKAHPILFIQHHFSDLAARARRFLLVPNTLSAVTTALMFVLSAVLAVLLLGRGGTKFLDNEHPGISPEDVVTIDFSPSMPATGTVVGVGYRGRIGLTPGPVAGAVPRSRSPRRRGPRAP